MAFFFLFLSVPSNVKLLENINQGAGFRVETPIQYSFLGSEKAERWQENGIKRVLDSVEKRTNKSLIRNGASFARICFLLTLFKMKGEGNEGGGRRVRGMGKKGKKTPSIFSPVTSTNVGISSRNFLTFSFNPFPTMASNVKTIPSASPRLLHLDQKYPQKNCFFWTNPYEIEVMITSLIEMLQLPNFDHMTTTAI